jgi:hypothetical protein
MIFGEPERRRQDNQSGAAAIGQPAAQRLSVQRGQAAVTAMTAREPGLTATGHV